MHPFTVLVSVLTVTPAVSAYYTSWDDQELIARDYFDADDYLYATLRAREWSDKAIQAGKDAIAVNHAEKSPQGHLVLPDKVVEFAGRVEGQFLPHKDSTPMKPNPAPTAEQSKQGKSFMQDVKTGAQLAIATTKNTIGNNKKSDAVLGGAIGAAEGAAYHVGGKLVDAVAKIKDQHTAANALKSAVANKKKGKRDLAYLKALYIRDLLEFENELQARELEDLEDW